MNKNLLTIKQFSKLTNTHPKSLRYYDSIGILKPVYVNPENGYRYYSVYQIEIIHAIKIFIETDIPLKTLTNFEKDKSIDYGNLTELLICNLEEKIKKCQHYLTRAQNYQQQMELAEKRFLSNVPTYQKFDSINCVLSPYQGTQHTEEWHNHMNTFLLELYRTGYEPGYHTGICRILKNEIWEQYLFISIDHIPETNRDQNNLFTFPAGYYLCNNVQKSDLDYVWYWTKGFIESSKISIIIETELFLKDYAFFPPPLEQRCFISTLE